MIKEVPINPEGGDIQVALHFPTHHFVGYSLVLRQGQFSLPIGIGDNEQEDEADRFLLPGPASNLLGKKLWCELVVRKPPRSRRNGFTVVLSIVQGGHHLPDIEIEGELTDGDADVTAILKFVEAA